MADIKRFDGNGRLSRAVIHGDTLYLCGQTAGGDAGDIKAQTKVVLDKIDALLETHGSDRDHILSATIYITDMGLFSQMNEVWDAWVRDGHEPARACVRADLASEALLVEISIVAALK